MGYGFDLDEWVTEAEFHIWNDYMNSHLGWPHLLGGRPDGPNTGTDHTPYLSWNAPMGYSSYEHHLPSYDVYQAALTLLPDQPVLSEDRFRLRDRSSKDVSMEGTRRGLWISTIVGGVANIWGYEPNYPLVSTGVLPSAPYPNPEQIRTYATFFASRFSSDLIRSNTLTDGYALRRPTNTHYLFYKEETISIDLDLSAMNGSQPAIAIDTTGAYLEINLGELTPINQVWLAPYRSDWAIAVGNFN